MNIGKEEFKNRHRIFKSQSSKYYCITFSMIFILGFFLSSNYLFNKNFVDIKSTPLEQKITLENITFNLISRKYNEDTGLFQGILHVSNSDLQDNNSIGVDVKIDTDPQNTIKSNLVKVSNNYYIVTTYLKENWHTVSLVVSKSINEEEKKSISVYSNKDDVEKDNKLKEENLNAYNILIVNLEIENINKEIQNITQEISTKNKLISNLSDDNTRQKANEKYQTEDEIKETENKINQNNKIIEDTKNSVTKLLKSLEEQKKRVEKLQEKKYDLEKSK